MLRRVPRSADAWGYMSQLQYKPLGPLLSGKDSRAFLGLEIFEGKARPIVLVWVPEDVDEDHDLRTQLQQETRRALVLDHPNVLRVHGLARMEEGLARVVEYADGESLRRLLERTGKVPAPIAARIVANAALGVQYAHQAAADDGRPWTHGDLRPETLLISYGGLTKVSGYGAIMLSERRIAYLKESGRTQHFAPEQLLGGREMATPQTDVFLLGLVLYEALTGSAPFVGTTGNDDSSFRMELPLLREGDVPTTLIPTIEKATALKASQRHASPQALREELEQRVGPLPTHHELSQWVAEAMKGDRSRAGRQREVDAGIADFAKSQWRRRGDQAYSDEVTNAGRPDVISPDAVKQLRLQAAEAERARAEASGQAPKAVAAAVVQFPDPSRAVTPHEGIPAVLASQDAVVARSTPPEGRPAAARAPEPARRTPPAATAPARRPNASSAAPAVASNTPVPPAAQVAPAPAPVAQGSSKAVLYVGVAALVVAVLLTLLNFLRPQQVVIAPPAPAPVVAAPLPPPEPQPEPTQPEPAQTATAAAATPTDDVPEPSVARPVAPARSSLSLTVDPPVNVTINGKSHGRTPLTVDLPPGRHKVLLTDGALGIRSTQTLTVGNGPTRRHIELGKGTVTVNATPGATVHFNGRKVGVAPLGKDVELYEGSHEILVTYQKAKWRQKFTLSADESVSFKVEADVIDVPK